MELFSPEDLTFLHEDGQLRIRHTQDSVRQVVLGQVPAAAPARNDAPAPAMPMPPRGRLPFGLSPAKREPDAPRKRAAKPAQAKPLEEANVGDEAGAAAEEAAAGEPVIDQQCFVPTDSTILISGYFCR